MASLSSSSTTTKKPPKVKQACDQCHARKVRCCGLQPCTNCQTTSLSCTYLSVPKKKGPKGPSKRIPRAILKMQMRQEHVKSPDIFVPVKPAESSYFSSPSEHIGSVDSSLKPFEPSPLLSIAVAEEYVGKFFKHKYAVMPILHRDRFYASMANFRASAETYAIVASICAAMMSSAQPDHGSVSSPDVASNDGGPSVDFFIGEAKRARLFRDHVEKPTLCDAQTSFFLFAALFNYDRHNSAWFFLREAMTMLQILRLHEEDTYLAMDPLTAVFSRRTYWLLFLTERAYALQRHRPLTLQRTIELPTIEPDDPDAPIINGFLDLVSLFQNFDDNFVALWNFSSRTPSIPGSANTSAESSNHLAALQAVLAMAIPDVAKRTETQQADLLISRQWLKTMVWQLCVSKGLLSSSSQDESMSFQFPVTISRDVVSVSRLLKAESFEPHGPGILEKVFDIGCSLADVMQLHPKATGVLARGMEIGPRDYLMEMLRLCSTVLGGSSRYVPLLAAKAEEVLHVTPQAPIDAGTERIFEIEDEAAYLATPNQEAPSFYDSRMDVDYMDGGLPPGFDFGALSEASIAWLGSMSNDGWVDAGNVPNGDAYQHG